MQKFLSLVAAFIMAVGAFAQDTPEGQEPETWAAGNTVTNNVVELTSITAEFLNNTSKGSVSGAGTWSFSSSYAYGDQNSMEVRFTPSTSGRLVITSAASIASNKSVNMFVNDDPNKTMDAIYGDQKIESGVNVGNQGFEEGLPSGCEVMYEILPGNTYNFYFGGTKWRLKKFTFTPCEVAGGLDEVKKVAYVTGDADSDFILQIIDEARLEATAIDANSAEVTLADLQEYEAVIVSPFVAADAAIVPVLKSAIAYEPMVNLNASLYDAWGLGTVTATDAQSVTLTETFAEDETYASIAGGEAVVMDGYLSAITLGDYFANDAVIATIGESVAMHRHNAGRNTYVNVPLTAECVPNFDIFGTFLGDIAVYAAGTKRGVSAAAAPKITQKNEDKLTTVTISAADGAVIYYTTDGNDPTEESTVYTEPLVLTQEAVVKAFATLDGYLPSPVATLDAIILSQVATPTFNLVYDEASTTVEISCATEDADIYYSYRVFSDTIKAQKYEGPIVLSSEPTYIYAMGASANAVNSELASEYVAIKSLNAETIRMDTVSHFSSCQAAWMPIEPAEGATGEAKAHYYWGKSAWSYYSDEVDHTEIVTDEEGNEVEKTFYKPDPNALRVIYPNPDNGTENDWRITSCGQALVGELTGTAADGVGEPTGAVLAGRYADTAEDLIGGLSTTGFLSFKAAQSGEPNSGAVESVKAFKAPFDVVVYVGNGSGGNKYAELQLSTDGQTWEKYADLKVSTVKRYIKKTRVAVNDEGSYYVRVANVSNGLNVADVYVLNHGEVSQAYEPEAGIDDIEISEAYIVRTEIYNINGMLTPRLNRGINIVRTYYSDGSVKTAKVLRR